MRHPICKERKSEFASYSNDRITKTEQTNVDHKQIQSTTELAQSGRSSSATVMPRPFEVQDTLCTELLADNPLSFLP
jgi:hypothetical protein